MREIRRRLTESLQSIEEEMIVDLQQRLSVTGSEPSRPGEYPHLVTGTLQGSIEAEVTTDGDDLILALGSNDDPGKVGWLEENRLLFEPTLEDWRRVIMRRVAEDTGLMP